MRGWAIIWSSVLLVGLAGCYPEYQPENHGMGDSIVHNVAEQVVNPQPDMTIAPTNLNGNRAAAAYSRYQSDRVIRPLATSIGGIGGGGATAVPGGAGAAVGVAPQ
jgi:hypothetical protein